MALLNAPQEGHHMPEETDPVTEPVEPQGAEEPEGGEATELSPEQLRAELAKVRREAAARRVEANELKTFKTEVEALAATAAEAELTEAQKATARAEAAEKNGTDLATENARLQVRLELGLTAEQAEFLSGTDVETMTASATKLLATFAPVESEGEEPPSHRIAPKVRPAGIDPTVSVEERDPAKLALAALKRSGRNGLLA